VPKRHRYLILNHDDLGRLYIDEYGAMEVSDHLKNYIDYEAYGRDVSMNEIGHFTDRGYIRDNGDSFTEYYDGSRESIPKEYLVMSAPEDISYETQKELDDMMLDEATDLAFDMDTLLRAANTEYSTTHFDFQERQEDIADSLINGDYAGLKKLLKPIAESQGEHSPTAMVLIDRMDAFDKEFIHKGNSLLENSTKQVQEEVRTYDIYQLKDFPDRREYAFAALGRLHEQGRSVDIQNYDKVYFGVMAADENLESVYTRFNIDRPTDFTGHSLSMSDVVVVHQSGQDTAHYCDSFGFSEVPEFLTVENHLKNAEMAMEDDLGMIDGIINNGKKDVTPPGTDEKPSIIERLSEAKRECSERKPPEVKKPDKGEPEHNL